MSDWEIINCLTKFSFLNFFIFQLRILFVKTSSVFYIKQVGVHYFFVKKENKDGKSKNSGC